MPEAPRPTRFSHPRFWPTWLAYAGLKLAARMPRRMQMQLGRMLGHALRVVQRRQRLIAKKNIEICFPALDADAQDALLRRHFESLGLSLIEMAIAWHAPAAVLHRRIELNGQAHLDAALAKGRGVILVTAHFTMLELGVAALDRQAANVACLYRPQRNALMDAIILAGRARFSTTHIPRDNVRALLRRLKANDIVLYLPDQTYIGNQSALLPFFGEPALTNVATPKLAAMSGATVLTYFFRRLPDDSGYVAEIGPPFEGFPGPDPIEDARRLFARLETFIRLAPEQYLWVYKKFKRRPAPLPDPYARR